MNLFQFHSGKRISKELVRKFDALVSRLGGEGRLADIFQSKHASGIGQQANIVDQLHDGVPVENLVTPSPRGISAGAGAENAIRADKERLRAKIGTPAFTKFMAQNRGTLQQQWPAVLEALGEAPKRTASAPSAPATVRPTARCEFVPAPEPAKHVSTPPARPTRRIASQPTDGGIDLQTARARTKEIFGVAPCVTTGQNQASQWRDLETVFHQHGHCAPWGDPISRRGLALTPRDAMHQRREAKIAALFPGCRTTAEASTPPPDAPTKKELKGRDRFLKSIRVI